MVFISLGKIWASIDVGVCAVERRISEEACEGTHLSRKCLARAVLIVVIKHNVEEKISRESFITGFTSCNNRKRGSIASVGMSQLGHIQFK